MLLQTPRQLVDGPLRTAATRKRPVHVHRAGAGWKPGLNMATILIVDERALDRGLAVALEHHGHRLLESDDGEDALEIVRAGAPDLVLTDILLPEPGG